MCFPIELNVTVEIDMHLFFLVSVFVFEKWMARGDTTLDQYEYFSIEIELDDISTSSKQEICSQGNPANMDYF